MKSEVLPSFWSAYKDLEEPIRHAARKAYRLWAENPFHPSLHFKYINEEEGIWAVRVTQAYRALGVLQGDTVTWFWIGSHDDCERFFG
jgi:mRNA-degrading endonuclease RelE of RelBE toxin-antitoxin system